MTNIETKHIGYAEIRDAMKSTLPAGTIGRVEIRPIEITQAQIDIERMRGMIQGAGRMQRQDAGTITGLYRSGRLWMSDSTDEMYDHIPFVMDCHRAAAESVLIGGLGMGMVVTGLLRLPSIKKITVIELDAEVIELVEPHLQALCAAAGVSLRVIQGDCMDPRVLLGKDERFDGAWIDIWEDLSTDNLAEMATISRRLARRVGFQGYWGRELLKVQRERERRQPSWVW